jgi:peptidoglycan-associated lipoprotein
MNDTTKLLPLIATVFLLQACGPAQTRADHASNVPQSGQAIHQAPADGQLGDADLEEPDPQANVVKGDPPPYHEVMASYADPVGQPPTWRDSAIGLHASLMQACGIEDRYAYFAFDSAGLSELAKETLGKLSTCFTNGALKGQGMVVTGHTDPQGTDKYNDELGKSRAQAVADHLAEQGMPKNKMQVISAGEKDASENPISWPRNRRVDIHLAE